VADATSATFAPSERDATRVGDAARAVVSTTRVTSIDALRGAVMVIMALDHTRDFVHHGAMLFRPDDLAHTTPLLFLTRWVTHICAPAFVFLAGISAFLWLQRSGSKGRLSHFLWTRGIWLVLVEVTVMRAAMNFSLGPPYPILLIILSALGLSMVALAALIHLPPRVLAILSVAILVLHNALDGIRASDLGAGGWLWTLLHQPGVITAGGILIVVGYPVLPWAALMAAGYCFGQVFALDPERRRRVLARTGAALVVGFVALRAINVYGDPAPWTKQGTAVFTMLSFLNTTKYPPSLEFLLMTLGPALLWLADFERRRLAGGHPLVIIGRVPFFFYIVHFWALHVLASVMAWFTYGGRSLAFLFSPFPSMGGARELFPAGFGYPLWTVYLAWAGIVVMMYPLCVWFAGVKARRREWWMSYL
jgi:uncharacterized membrane protein